jgi:DNA-binding CsgD family transcriptional regulator
MIVGRDLELRRVAELLEAARDGRAGSLVVRGEPGIGKTALLEAAATEAARQGFRVLRVTGVESEAELAYSGLLELTRPILDLLEALAEPQQVALRGALVLEPGASGDRFAVAVATLSLLAEAAEQTPLLVLVDDAQWLDAQTAEALWFAARRLDADTVAVLIAARSGESSSLDEQRFGELPLTGVDVGATAGLLRRDDSVAIPPAVIEALHAGSAGNPLALLEMARSMTRAQLAGSEPLADPVYAPTRLDELFARRIGALGQATQRALLVLAISGSDSFATVLAALSALGLAVDDLFGAESDGLVELDAASARFCHPLMRAAVYHSARPAERRAAHAALADASGDSERAIWHRAEAALGPDESLSLALEGVAREARSRGGYLAAGAALIRAAALTPEASLRAGRLFAAADAFWAVGAAGRARSLLTDAALACDDPRLMADIRHLEGHIVLHSTSPEAAHELLLREGLAIAELDPDKAAFMIGEAAEAILYLGDFEETLATARVGERWSVADGGMGDFFISAIAGCGLVGTGSIEEGVRELRRSIAIVETSELLAADPRALGWLVPLYGWADAYAEALALARRAAARARAVGALGDLVYVLVQEAGYEYLLGAWPRAYAHASESVLLARETGQTIEGILALSGLAELEAVYGREAACRDAVAECQKLTASLDAMHEWPAFALGLLELGMGRAAEAVAALAPAVTLSGCQAQQRAVMAVFDLLEAHLMCGNRVAARAVLEAVEASYAGRPWVSGGAARGRGMLAEHGEYDEAFATSRDVLSQLGMRFEVARTELCWGERLRRDRRRKESREHLRLALATFDELGARPWSDRAGNELRASGETLRRDIVDREELSARELQVALQAAEGKTNREVGAALFLSPKTVDIHLSRVYRKLGIHSRGELEGALAHV